MIVTATELANESKSIIDRVVQGGEVVEIQCHGRTVAVIQPRVGVSRAELPRLLRDRGFSQKDSEDLQAAMDAVSEVIGYAGENLQPHDEGPFYIPALAAAEFLVGTQPPVRADLRQRAMQLYQTRLRNLVSAFSETDASHLVALISDLKAKGAQMKFFDAAIAATVIARRDKLLALDGDYDHLKDCIQLLRPN